MKQNELSDTIDETLTLLADVADEYLDEISEQLAAVGSPEKLMGKSYEQFTPQDLMLLGQVYGGEPNPLSNLIFKKKYEEVKALEAEEVG